MPTMAANATGPPAETYPFWLMPVAIAILVLVLFFVQLLIFARNFVKVGPNQALIVSGRTRPRQSDEGDSPRRFRIVKGGGTFVWPIVEKYDLLSLELFGAELRDVDVRAAAGEPLRVDAAAQARIGDDDGSLERAAVQLLSKSQDEITGLVREVLRGAIVGACGSTSAEDIRRAGDAMGAAVGKRAGDALAAMGVRLDNLVLRNIRDGAGRPDKWSAS